MVTYILILNPSVSNLHVKYQMMTLSFNSSRTMNITSGAVTTFSSGSSGPSPYFSVIRGVQSLVFCLMF